MASLPFKALLTIMEISHAKTRSFQEKLRSILDEVLRCMNAEKGSIMLLKGKDTLEVAVSTDPGIRGVRQHIEEDTPSGWVVRNKRTLYVGPGAKDLSFANRYGHYKKDAFLLAPIMNGTKVIGVLSITDRIDADCFSAEEQELLLTIAGEVISTIDREQLSESLRKSRDNVRRKNLELEKLERIRTELFNMLIHDLKGPLSEVVASLDILSYTTTGDELECVETAQTGCDTLFRMISDLLDITRIEEGCLKLVCEKLEASSLVHEAVLRLSGSARSRGVVLKETMPEGQQVSCFWGDRGILMRVLQNLIVNAVQHSPGVSSIEVGCEEHEGLVTFFVQDHGPGISPEYHEAIFHKFFQITKKHDGRRYSTGLGLTFCKMAVEAHHGSIRVESDGVNGSRFVFTLPVNQAQASPQSVKSKAKQKR